MTIASEITKLNTNLTNSYTACQNKGATMPANQNFDNLATCIGSIQTGSTPTLITKNITQNGTYNASSDNADGYSSVTVNVSGGGGTTYSYPELKGGNWYVLDDETVVPMSFSSVIFNGSSYSNVSVFATYQGIAVGKYNTTWSCSVPSATSVINNVNLTNTEALDGKTIKHISIGFPQSNVTSVKLQNFAFKSISTLQSVSISNMNNLVLTGTFKGCTNLSEVDVSSVDSISQSGALSGTASKGGAFSECTSLQTLSFNSLKSTSFGSYTNQFNYMLKGVTGCAVHFPSNLQSVIGSWSSVTSGFGGTNTTVLFDLPATT